MLFLIEHFRIVSSTIYVRQCKRFYAITLVLTAPGLLRKIMIPLTSYNESGSYANVEEQKKNGSRRL